MRCRCLHLIAAGLALALGGCGGFRVPPSEQGTVEAGPAGDLPPSFDRLTPAGEQRRERGTGEGLLPTLACRPLELPCLDPGPPNLIEVPLEMTAEQAFASAKAGDTIQIRGLSLGAGWAVPAYVTLRGCAGARIVKWIRFAGSGGVVEGFEVSGQVIANATGSFVVRQNRFVGGGDPEAGISARSIDALVPASVALVADGNWFEQRPLGVEARTKYDTLTHEVELTVRNNIFTGVESPLVVSEDGLVGKIKAVVEHNTFHAFKYGITLLGISQPTVLSGNLLLQGTVGVQASSPFELRYCLGWQVTTAHNQAPLAGVLASADPLLADAAGGDFRPGGASPLLDAIPASTAVPGEDFRGCPRPVAILGGEARADIGAIEAQP